MHNKVNHMFSIYIYMKIFITNFSLNTIIRLSNKSVNVNVQDYARISKITLCFSLPCRDVRLSSLKHVG